MSELAERVGSIFARLAIVAMAEAKRRDCMWWEAGDGQQVRIHVDGPYLVADIGDHELIRVRQSVLAELAADDLPPSSAVH